MESFSPKKLPIAADIVRNSSTGSVGVSLKRSTAIMVVTKQIAQDVPAARRIRNLIHDSSPHRFLAIKRLCNVVI